MNARVSDPLEHWPLPGNTGLRDRLLAAYAAPSRGYHDLRHLSEVLHRVVELLGVEDSGIDRDAVLLAAWFHDAVYEGARDDEERSAGLARRELADAGVSPQLAEEVARLVEVTALHRPAAHDLAGQVLSDADLAILAAPPERYADYVAGVRKEYDAVPDDDFRNGRAAVLRDLLQKPALFHTSHARAHWEQPARANVQRELSELTG